MKSSELSIVMPVTLALGLTTQAYDHVHNLLGRAGLEQMESHLRLAADHLREAIRAYDEHMS